MKRKNLLFVMPIVTLLLVLVLMFFTDLELNNVFGISIASLLFYSLIGFAINPHKMIHEEAIGVSMLIIILFMVLTSF